MYIIYKFFQSYVDFVTSETQLDVWIAAACFTQLVDAEDQMQRFIDMGDDPDYLRLLMDSDPVPTDIPE